MPRRKSPSASVLLRLAREAGVPSKYRRSRKQLLEAVESNPEVFDRKHSSVQKLFNREPLFKEKYQAAVDEQLAAYIRSHPDVSGTKILKNFRQKTGLSFSDAFGRELIRRERHLELDKSKIRTKRVNGKELIIYGKLDAPVNDKFITGLKGRFYYLIRYGVRVNEQPDEWDQYAYFVSDFPDPDPYNWVLEQLRRRLRASSRVQGRRYKITHVDEKNVDLMLVIDTDVETLSVSYFNYIKKFT